MYKQWFIGKHNGTQRRPISPARPALLPFIILFIVILLTLRSNTLHADGHIIHVNQHAAGANDGSSWADAFTDLQAGLDAAEPGDEIWVAAGRYVPAARSDPTDPRTATFQLKDGVALFGGFDGTESARDQRDWELNRTVLSGDVDGDDNDNVAYDEPTRQDNNYHVVTAGSDIAGTTILDGFTISDGNANHDSELRHREGGGLHNDSGSPALTNITFTDNSSSWRGGGMYNTHGSPTLTNVTFNHNSSAHSGGGLNSDSGDLTFTNVIFSDNYAGYGGGMRNNSSNSTLTNVTFSGNVASSRGGGLFNSRGSPTFTSVIFSGNYAGWYGGGMANEESASTLISVTFTDNGARLGGGGLYNSNSSPTLTNVSFRGNYTGQIGAGIYNSESNPTLFNVTFNGNRASKAGGGMYGRSSNARLTNITFSGNLAEHGAGIYNRFSDPVLTNVTLSRNVASVEGGGLYNQWSNPEIYNSILWQNEDGTAETGADQQIKNDPDSSVTIQDSLVEGGCPTGSDRCSDILNLDPRFVRNPNDGGDGWWHGDNDDFGDFRLQSTSPVIDQGNNGRLPADVTDLDGDGNTTEPVPYDFAGNPRLVDYPNAGSTGVAIVDLGAFEVQTVDVTLTQEANPAEAHPGESVTLLLHFTNTGTGAAADVVIRTGLPEELTDIQLGYSGAHPTFTGERPPTWGLAEVPPGATGTISIRGVLQEGLPAGTTITNAATISTANEEIDETNNRDEVTLTVQNTPPTANDDTAATGSGTAVLISVLDSDSDANGDSLSISGVDTPASGSAVIEGNRIRYTPNSGFSGTDSFTYTVSDGELTDQATVTVAVQGGETQLFLPAVSR